MLRRALATEDIEAEANTETGGTVLMKGPLSEVFTKALDIAYANDKVENGEDVALESLSKNERLVRRIKMESQQMDVAIMQKLSNALNGNDTQNVQTVYGVSKDDVTDETIVDVTTELANVTEEGDFILVIDAVGNGEGSTPTEKVVELTNALECMVTAHGFNVFHSFSDYVRSNK